MKPQFLSVLFVLIVSAALATAQDFTVEPVAMLTLENPSAGEDFSVSGVLTPESREPMAGGAYEISGRFQTLVSSSPGANTLDLVINGRLEDGAGTFVPDGSGIMALPVGSEALPGWSIVDAEVAWISNANPFGPRTADGSLFLDLTGGRDAPPYGGIAQELTTVPDVTYRLTFALGAFSDTPEFRGPVRVAVTTGDARREFTLEPPEWTPNQWSRFSVEFTATSVTTPLAISGLESSGARFLGVDEVSVVPRADPTPPLELDDVKFEAGALSFSFPEALRDKVVLEVQEDLGIGAWETLPLTVNGIVDQRLEVAIPVDPTRQYRFFRLKRLP